MLRGAGSTTHLRVESWHLLNGLEVSRGKPGISSPRVPSWPGLTRPSLPRLQLHPIRATITECQVGGSILLPIGPMAHFTLVSPATSRAAPGNIGKAWQTDLPKNTD